MREKGILKSQVKSKKIDLNADNDSLKAIIDAILEKKASDVVDLNLSKLENTICDYFVIASGNSPTQVAAIADNVEAKMIEKLGAKVTRRGGDENAFWIILDYGDIMVHVFLAEYRDFYRLEELWGDAIITSHDDKINLM